MPQSKIMHAMDYIVFHEFSIFHLEQYFYAFHTILLGKPVTFLSIKR